MTEQERIDIAYLDTGVYENPWRENLFETLPEDRKTAEVCRFAIKKSAFNIEFVPEAMKTPELCLAAAGAGAHLSAGVRQHPAAIRRLRSAHQ